MRKPSMQVIMAVLLIGCGNQETLLAPAQATGVPTASTDLWLASQPAAFSENQDILMQFNGWLAQQQSIHEAGYIASIDDTDNRSITLLWSGPNSVPDVVTRRALADSIVLKIQPWRLSYAQIHTAAQALATLNKNFFGASGFNLADVVGIDPSFQGVSIEGTFSASVSDVAAAVDRLTAQAQALVGVPVRVVNNVSTGHATGRDNDQSPFSAGGYMFSPSTDGVCSTGFGIEIGGVTHATTARHCTATDYVARDARATQYVKGISTVVNSGAARYLGGAASTHCWDGTYDKQGFQKTVSDYADVSLGDKVCTDGGNSGVHCNVQVNGLMILWDDGTGNGPTETIRGQQLTAGQIAVIQGDSGGPVLVPVGLCLLGINCRVHAAGMIQAWWDAGTLGTGSLCGPIHDVGGVPPNLCSDSVLFTSMRAIVNGIPGGSLVHG